MNSRLDQPAYCRTRHHENSSAPSPPLDYPPPYTFFDSHFLLATCFSDGPGTSATRGNALAHLIVVVVDVVVS